MCSPSFVQRIRDFGKDDARQLLSLVGPARTQDLRPRLEPIDEALSDEAAIRKWRDVLRSGRAAIVVDDVLPHFRPRGIEIRGRAEVVAESEPSIVVYPDRIVAWGLDDVGGHRNARSVRGTGSGTRMPA
jgi:hypothetical protein